MEQIRISLIRPSKTNPRRERADAAEKQRLADLTESIRSQGVLQPVLVRPLGDPDPYELVCGHRRLAAAAAAGLEAVPAIVRSLSDQEALEVQLVENAQRADLHPLEEAEGYHRLSRQPGYSVAKVAAKVGHPVRHVADRIRLLSLTKPAQELFLEGKFAVGHAVLLSRLKSKDQERALAVDDRRGHGGLFEQEALLWSPERDEQSAIDDPVKARSVGELKAWIDEHVKFDPGAADVPELFPEVAAHVRVAREAAEKIVPITHEHYVQPDARDGQRVYGPRSWKRADGKRGCEKSCTAVVVVGAGRGTAFRVCVDKACKVHWAREQREAKKRAAGGGGEAARARELAAQQRRAEQEKAADAVRGRWKKAAPAIAKAVAEAVRKAPATAGGLLAELLLEGRGYRGADDAAKLVPRGRTAEDLVRHLAFLEVYDDVVNEWRGPDEGLRIAKALGVDARKILGREAPAEKPTKVARTHKKVGR